MLDTTLVIFSVVDSCTCSQLYPLFVLSLIEPNGYTTDRAGASAVQADTIEAYNDVKTVFQVAATRDVFGKPEATAAAILKLVNSPNPPLRLLMGKMTYPHVKEIYGQNVWRHLKHGRRFLQQHMVKAFWCLMPAKADHWRYQTFLILC